MKVTFVTNGLKAGGAELMLYKILSRLDRSRVECDVINLRPPGPVQELIESLGIPVQSLGWSSLFHAVCGLYNLRRLLQKSRPNLIHSWTYYSNIGVTIATRGLGRAAPPLLWGIRFTLGDLSYEKRSTKWLIRQSRKLARIPKAILYDSETGRRDHERLGYPHELGRVIPNGIDFDTWRIDPVSRNEVRSQLGIGSDCFVIGMVGRMHPSKDHVTFLQAAERFLQLHPNAHFLLAGSGTEPNSPQIRSLLNGDDFKGRLHLLGHQTDVARVMAALDLHSCASRTESFPNVVLEALACGVLSTVSEVGDAPQLVPDRRFVVPPAAPLALADAWDRIASLVPADRASLACEFRKTAIERYSIAAIAQKYEAVYQELAR
jgi:glycosyltransferase involved in cell wall biosynthesis